MKLAPICLQYLLFNILKYAAKIVYKSGKELSHDCEFDSLTKDKDKDIIEVSVDVPIPMTTFSKTVSTVNEDD